MTKLTNILIIILTLAVIINVTMAIREDIRHSTEEHGMTELDFCKSYAGVQVKYLPAKCLKYFKG